jgi:hypothetical protein
MHDRQSEAVMLTSREILAGLSEIADRGFGLAVGWHALLLALLVALVAGWRPSSRLSATALAAPLASVSALAWAFANPFNGAVFAVLAIAVAWLGLRAPRVPIALPDRWTLTAGALLLAYAWVYPHFLDDRTVTAYLYGSPMGLVPCPSLSLAIGLALITGRSGGRAASLILVAAGTFYALFGMLRLGVWLDLGLFAGALGLLATVLAPSPRRSAIPVA